MITKSFPILLVPTVPNDETGKGIWINKTRDWVNLIIIDPTAEIKSGNFYISNKGIRTATFENNHLDGVEWRNCKKIIASSDPSLKTYVPELRGELDEYERLPLINPSDIEWYVNNYNEGNIIKEVELEMEGNIEWNQKVASSNSKTVFIEALDVKCTHKIKTNAVDGSVVISREKKEVTMGETKVFLNIPLTAQDCRLYTREELRDFTLKFWFHWYNHIGGTNTEEGLDKFMENNLK